MANKTYNLAESTVQKMKEIAEKRDIGNDTEIIRYCVAEVHAKEFPDYLYSKRPKATAEEKAIEQIDKEDLKEKRRKLTDRKEAADICTLLAGTISTNQNGKEVCDYIHYSYQGPQRIQQTRMSDELTSLNGETPMLQYQGLMGNETPEAAKAAIQAVLAKQAAQ